MEEKRATILIISDLIHRARPLAAAASLVPSCPRSTSQLRKCSYTNHSQKSSSHVRQNPNLRTLKPLNESAVLIGIVTLPTSSHPGSSIKCNCFQFSDHSGSICCDILDFNPKMIDQKIRVLAWNFIPLKYGNRGVKGGFLEIITWDFVYPCSDNVCSLSRLSCFCLSLGACDVKDDSKASSLIFGVLESISPVSAVPCASGERCSTNINAFLVNILVCQCKRCALKYPVPELEDLCREKVEDHCFSKSMTVYFCGLASSWHAVVSKFIGYVAILTGLKKKLVYIREVESHMMYVTTDDVSFHTKLFKERGLNHNRDIRGKGECGNYTGVITGSYMHGMALELDQDVISLLTDQHRIMPHSFRVGALVTLKNVHFVDPKFRWGKMLILGSCYRTSVHVESFSPLESWLSFYTQSQHHRRQNHLQCVIQNHKRQVFSRSSLIPCRLQPDYGHWLSSRLLGKNLQGFYLIRRSWDPNMCSQKEGLAQKYASSHLPLSAFQCRHGVLLEFCNHDLCPGSKETDCSHLRMVPLIAHLVSYCEASWKEVLDEQENYSNFTGGIIQKEPIWCGGRPYEQSIKRVLRSEEIGVIVLGTLKISSSSGRLQLVDATGGVDILLDNPALWDLERIFEAKNFRIIIEGVPSDLVDLDSTIYHPLSCRSIFSNALPLRRLKTSIFLYTCPSDENSGSHSHSFGQKGNSLNFDYGKYHLLMLTHKFPIQQKFRGDLAKRFNVFAEAIVLPWYLVVAGKYQDAGRTMISSGHCQDSLKNFGRHKFLTNKRCKVAGRGANLQWMGTLHFANGPAEFISDCNPPRRKILLEFTPDSFCKYEALKIGHRYLVKLQEGQMLCYTKESQESCAKVSITSGTDICSLTLSSVEYLQNDNPVDGFPFCNSHISNEELIPKEFLEFGIPCLVGHISSSEIYSDINIFVCSGTLNLLENVIKNLEETRDSFVEESDIHDHGGCMINGSMQSSRSTHSDYPLPEGNLITLCGLVLAFHDCHGVSSAQPCPVHGEGSLQMFLQEQAGVCLHVFADNHIVRILSNLSRENYPIGLGRDIYATFHRVLVLSEPNKYMMTSVSFITIDHKSLIGGNLTHDLNYASGTVGLHCVSSPNSVPMVLISDVLESSDFKPMQFRCRVVALYILALEKIGTTATSQSCLLSKRFAFGVPLAAFIMDDGSGSCCCWADSDRAAAFVGLLEDYSLGRCNAHLNQVLEQHGRIIVKYYGSMFNPCSGQELIFTSQKLVTSRDEDVLRRSLVSNALFSTTWNVVGRVMDPKGRRWLGERLNALDVGDAVPPLPNIWATSVCPTDMLGQARNLINGLTS